MKRTFLYALPWCFAAVGIMFTATGCGDDEGGKGESPVEKSLSADPTSLSFTAEGETLQLNVKAAGVRWTVAAKDSWLSLDNLSGTGDATLNVTAAKNTVTSERTSTITLSANGVDPVTVQVTQAAFEGLTEWTLQSDWTVAYDGQKTDVDGSTSDYISCKAGESDSYFIGRFSVANISGKTDAQVCDLAIEEISDLLTEYNLTWADYVTSGEDSWSFGLIDAGTYVVYAIGVESDGTKTYKYAKSEEFTITEAEPVEGYTKWIGKWTISGVSPATKEEVSFSLDVQKGTVNKTFIISGWEPNNKTDIQAVFDETSGNLQFVGYDMGEVQLDGETGTFMMAFVGMEYVTTEQGSGYSILTPGGYTYPIGTATISGNSATVTAETVEFMDGSTMTFTNMGLGAYSTETVYRLYKDYPGFPMTMTKEASTTKAASAVSFGVLRQISRTDYTVKSGIKANLVVKTLK